MFKDWSLIERFLAGFSRERPPRAFLPAAHQFEAFLKTLIREVGKRSVLSDATLPALRMTDSAAAARYN